jgi:hypothetical protein
LAGIYALAASGLLAASLLAGGIGLWLAWPAASLMLVALNYAGLGARGFQMDHHGRMRWAARWLFGPYRLGAAINAWLWTRHLPASVLVVPGVRLGRIPTTAEWKAAGEPRLISLCAELQLPQVPAARCLPRLDLVTPSPIQLQHAAVVVQGARSADQVVWICCALGFSRSAATVATWLRLYGSASTSVQAEATVRLARPQIVMNADLKQAIDLAAGRPA